MAGRSGPPGGPFGDLPGSGDEEFRSTVFDESFVRSAALEEYSAQQRLEDQTSPVRSRVAEEPARGRRTLPKNALVLAAIMVIAVLVALLLGTGGPYGNRAPRPEPQPAANLLPLAPAEAVPGGEPSELYEGSPAADFGVGGEGAPTPEPVATEDFTRDQVAEALALAQRYVVASALTPEVLGGGTALPVRVLLHPEQQRQLDRSLTGRAGESPATAWLVRFDPAETELADRQVRARGSFTASQNGSRLEVTARHLAVYALRPAGDEQAPASLFMVHRTVVLAFTEQDLAESRAVLLGVSTVPGPVDCAVDQDRELHPLLAGQEATLKGPVGMDPFALADEGNRPCGALAGLET